MKRFIDLGKQILGMEADEETDLGFRAFAWYDTVRCHFETHSGSQDWHCWHSFETDYEGDELARYKRLAQEWTFYSDSECCDECQLEREKSENQRLLANL